MMKMRNQKPEHRNPKIKSSHQLLSALIFVCATLSQTVCTADVYYVDRNSLGGPCSDSNPGTLTQPWCTIKRASSGLQPGDIVYIREGTYEEKWIYITHSGSEGKTIRYAGFPEEEVILAGNQGGGFYLTGVSYIQIDNLLIDGQFSQHTGIYLDEGSHHIVLRNLEIKNIRHPTKNGGIGIWIDKEGASDISIENVKLHDVSVYDPYLQSGSGIVVAKGNRIKIRNCEISDINLEDAIHLGHVGPVKDVLIENCRMWHNKEDAIDMKNVTNVTVRNCIAYNHKKTPTGGGSGVVVHIGAQNVLIDNSTFFDNDRGVAIVFGSGVIATSNITVQRSVFYDNREAGIFVGDRTENMVKNVRIYNNVIFENVADGLYVYASAEPVIIKNNIFWKNKNRDVVFHSFLKLLNLESDYNMYPDSGKIYSSGRVIDLREMQSRTNQEQNSFVSDPMFIDPSGHNFGLKSGSPAIDKGIDVGIPYTGGAPDVGAYEYPFSGDDIVDFMDFATPAEKWPG